MKAKKGLSLFCGIAISLFGAISFPAYSADNDALMNLLKVLRDKGTISESDYQALAKAAAAEGKKPEESKTPVADKKMEKLDWATKIKLKGDMRDRYEFTSTDGAHDRSRGRLRYRLGVIANPIEAIEVGAGLASGSTDPRSTNQTFSDTFSSKGINLDYAYGQVSFDDFQAIAGKFNPWGKYIFVADDLMWDDDLRPEGFSTDYAFKNELGTTFVNGGIWVLGEFAKNGKDPYMAYAQLGQKLGDDDLFATVAGSYYDFISVRQTGASAALVDSNVGAFSAGTNTGHRFDSASLDAELGTKHLFDGAWSGSLFGNIVNNVDLSGKDTGYSFGAKLGTGPWGFKYIYANLDANAFPDIFPDSDRFNGATDIRGHEGIVSYDVNKYVNLGLDYYHSTRKSTDADQDLLQADVVFKF